jgi:hypothetical protein
LDALYHNCDMTLIFISESEHYTIVSVISPAFHQSPKTESINIEQASNSCQSCMAKISKQLAKFGNAGHSCLIFILSGLLIQLPFGLILHYGFFRFYISSTTTTMMLYSIISYPVGIVLYLFCSFLYFWVSWKILWFIDIIFSIKKVIQILTSKQMTLFFILYLYFSSVMNQNGSSNLDGSPDGSQNDTGASFKWYFTALIWIKLYMCKL